MEKRAVTLCFVFIISLCLSAGVSALSSKKIKAKSLVFPSGIRKQKKRKEIILGFSAPLTRGIKELGKDLSLGIELAFNNINKSGGLRGYFLKLIVKDDHYDPEVSFKNISYFLKKTSIFFGLFGSKTLEILPSEVVDQSLILFPVSGSFRGSKSESMFFYRPTVKREVEVLVDHAIKGKHREKVAIFYEDSSWGRDGFRFAKRRLARYGKKPVVVEKYSRNTVNVAEQAARIVKAMPEVLICIGHSRSVYSLIKSSVNGGLQNCAFLGTSESVLAQKRLEEARGINLVTSSVVPSPWKSKLKIVKNYRSVIRKVGRDFSPFSLEGFIMATLFINALKKIKGPINKEKIKKRLESMKKINLMGLRLGFKNRAFSDSVWINLGQDKAWEKV